MSFNPPDRPAGSPLVVLADDLSGAAECAAVLPGCRRILLDPAAPVRPRETPVIDLDSRRRTPAGAARLVAQATGRHAATGARLLKKADSLLRGHLAAETSKFAAGASGLVVAPAVPAAGRTVRDGVVRLHGVPLHHTEAWRAEPEPVPRSVAEALGRADTTVLPLDQVRAGATHLGGSLRSALARGAPVVCDAETDADLDAVAAAVLRLPHTVRMVGAGGLTAALGRRCGPVAPRTAPGRAPAAPRPVVVVVGTAHPGAVAQIAQLTLHGARHSALSAESLLGPGDGDGEHSSARARAALEGAPVSVLSISGTGAVDPSAAPRLARALARSVAAVLPEDADLVLTGGETARRVLDELAVTSLLPVGQVHHGAVHCRTVDGREVVTRPGGFGGPDSLLRMVGALRTDRGRAVQEPYASDGGPR
ncbi:MULTISPECIES: four-carbon acid sugar kinase family protein [unclassified Streptomyces]|uniref:four-carbon acid sugar kinase family protein n=1 Tax=unclassified Streptomyces TaxID=2593676 RepID=UPI0038154D54